MLTNFFRRTKPIRKQPRLNLVSLEARDVPAFLVINSNNSGIGSLRQAVINANASPGYDQINFSAAFNTPQTINLLSQINVSEYLSINTPPAQLTIDGNNATRLFNVNNADGNGLFLNNLRLINGKTTGAANGPAVNVVAGGVHITDCVIDGNTSAAGGAVSSINGYIYIGDSIVTDNTANRGGAVYATASDFDVDIVRTTFLNNSTANGGGALYLDGSDLDLFDCTFEDNSAKFNGGAIFFDADGNYLIDGVTFLNNSSTHNGGAIAFENGNNPFINRQIENCTFVGNSALGSGGALSFFDVAAGNNTRIESCTITGNTAFLGGGIRFENAVVGRLFIASCIIVDNKATSNGANLSTTNINSTLELTYSAVTTTVGATLHMGSGSNLIGQTAASLQLGPLQDNGGDTLTMAIPETSPAFNNGVNYTTYGRDQRDQKRATNGTADIGAYETRQVYTVTNANDSGVGSLRQAVLNANALGESFDVIRFDPVFFSVPRTISLTSGGITSTDNVEIDGPGAKLLTINGNNAARPLRFNVGNPFFEIPSILRGVTVTNVNNPFAVGAFVEELVIEDCIIRNNSGGSAVAAYNSPYLTITRSAISDNLTGGNGGGVFFDNPTGKLTLRDSTVNDNVANQGGGLHIQGAIEILNSTISGNHAFSTNQAQGIGGGLLIRNASQVVRIWNSTITDNTAQVEGGGAYFANDVNFSISVDSSVVSNNGAQIGPDIKTQDIAAPVNSRNSAIGNHSGIAKLNNLGGNIATGTNLKLNPLASNGGLGLTHTPQPGSPLLNNGSNLGLLTTDQRGLPRFSGTGIDIGAAEVQIAPQIEVLIHQKSPQRSVVRSITVTFDRIVNLGANAFAIVRLGPDNPSGSFAFTTDLSGSTPTQTIAKLTWNAPNFTEFGSLIDGDYRLIAVASQITDANGVQLDGDGDGFGGDSHITLFHRLFGDSNGDRTIDGGIDFSEFGAEFGTSSGINGSIFDFNNDGTIDGGVDFAEFGARFGTSL